MDEAPCFYPPLHTRHLQSLNSVLGNVNGIGNFVFFKSGSDGHNVDLIIFNRKKNSYSPVVHLYISSWHGIIKVIFFTIELSLYLGRDLAFGHGCNVRS